MSTENALIHNAVVFDKEIIFSPSNSKLIFDELDGLRLCACFIVLIAHFNLWIDFKSPLMISLKTIFPGQLGVITFFCLSSFLITNILIREYNKNNKIQIFKFIIRRIMRIWPLYFLIMLISITFIWLGVNNPELGATSQEQWVWCKNNYWKYLLLIGNWEVHLLGEIGIMWTICVEEQFYLILPIIASIALRKKGYAVVVIMSCIIFGYIWRIGVVLNPNIIAQPLYYHTFTYIDCFSYGALAAYFHNKYNNIKYIRSRTLALISFLLLIVLLKFLGSKAWLEPYSVITILSYGFVPIVISYLILHLISTNSSMVDYFLRSKVLSSLGLISFGIYLWHMIVYRLINIQVFHMNFDKTEMNEIIYFLIFLEYCSLSILLSMLTFKFVELPFLRLRTFMYKDSSLYNARWNVSFKNLTLSCFILTSLTLSILFAMNMFKL